MRTGTKSLLFGVHNIVIHALFVTIAWWKLYGRPSFGEFVAIVIHDWGYFGKSDMDGKEGKRHPEWAALFFTRRRRPDLAALCLYHSRFLAKTQSMEPSRLCFADKLGSAIMPWWLWGALALMSGEWYEYNKPQAQLELHSHQSTKEFIYQYRSLVKRMLAEQRAGLACNIFAARWSPVCTPFIGEIKA